MRAFCTAILALAVIGASSVTITYGTCEGAVAQNKAQCDAAAGQESMAEDEPDYPSGCYENNGHAWFNENENSVPCSPANKCICKAGGSTHVHTSSSGSSISGGAVAGAGLCAHFDPYLPKPQCECKSHGIGFDVDCGEKVVDAVGFGGVGIPSFSYQMGAELSPCRNPPTMNFHARVLKNGVPMHEIKKDITAGGRTEHFYIPNAFVTAPIIGTLGLTGTLKLETGRGKLYLSVGVGYQGDYVTSFLTTGNPNPFAPSVEKTFTPEHFQDAPVALKRGPGKKVAQEINGHLPMNIINRAPIEFADCPVQMSLLEHVQRSVRAVPAAAQTAAAVAGAVSLFSLMAVFRMRRKRRAAYSQLEDTV